MGESTYADKIHTRDSIVVDSVNGDATTGLNLNMFAILLLPCTDNLHCTLGALRREVIQHDTVGDIRCQYIATEVVYSGKEQDNHFLLCG